MKRNCQWGSAVLFLLMLFIQHAPGIAQSDAKATWSLEKDTLRFQSAIITAAEIRTLENGRIVASNATVVTRGIEQPMIEASHVLCVLNASHDTLRVISQESEDTIRLYDGKHLFMGSLYMTPAGMLGNGSLYCAEYGVSSTEFAFSRGQKWRAEAAQFSILAPQKTRFREVLGGQANSIHCDMAHNRLEIMARAIPPSVGLMMGSSLWTTTLCKITYLGDEGEVLFEHVYAKPQDNYFSRGDYTIMAKSARLVIADLRLEIDGVPYIYIADAAILPAKEHINILPDGRIEDLKNAEIRANQETNYHRWFDASVHIIAANQYTATAKYDYISVGGKAQSIPFQLRVNRDTITMGEGEVAEPGFMFNDGFGFLGIVEMNARDKWLHWRGEVEVMLDRPFLKGIRFPMDIVAGPDSLFLPFNAAAQPYASGLYYDVQHGGYYAAFMGQQRQPADLAIAVAQGGIAFDRSAGEFLICQPAKWSGNEFRGNAVRYNPADGVISVIGKLAIPTRFQPKTIAMELSGWWKMTGDPKDAVKTDLVGSIDFDCIPKAAWEKLADKALVVTAVNESIDWSDQKLLQGVGAMLDPNEQRPDKQMQDLISQIEKSLVYHDIQLAAKIPTSLLLSGIVFHYDPEFNSLWYAGAVGILGLNGTTINKRSTSNTKIEYVPGKRKLAGSPASDTLRIYLEFDEMNWVFFEFYDDVVRTISSDVDGYNAVLRSPNSKKKGYRYERVEEQDKDLFLVHFVNRNIWRTGRS